MIRESSRLDEAVIRFIITPQPTIHFVHQNYLIWLALLPFHVQFSVHMSWCYWQLYHFLFQLLPKCPHTHPSINSSPCFLLGSNASLYSYCVGVWFGQNCVWNLKFSVGWVRGNLGLDNLLTESIFRLQNNIYYFLWEKKGLSILMPFHI